MKSAGRLSILGSGLDSLHLLVLDKYYNIARAIARNSQLVRPGVTQALFNQMHRESITLPSNAFSIFCCMTDVLNLPNLQITLALCLLLYYCTIMLHEIYCICRRPNIFHLIIILSSCYLLPYAEISAVCKFHGFRGQLHNWKFNPWKFASLQQ